MLVFSDGYSMMHYKDLHIHTHRTIWTYRSFFLQSLFESRSQLLTETSIQPTFSSQSTMFKNC
ncbi:unnamed protein product [Brassica napus]|uniref:(rape) hypothetical protein n=1 Tax=Brassica napus TaxID=3708 RepID=A0A816TW71_BRANA|nr:unnamed protein product [Brassica napus]